MIKHYELRVRKTVITLMSVKAHDTNEALKKFNDGDIESEQEIDLVDTEVESIKEDPY